MVPQKTEEQSSPHYCRLSPRLSQLLYRIATLEQKKERATRKKLAAMMNTSPNNISNLINQLKSAEYVNSYPDEGDLPELTRTDRHPGRLPAVYYLDVDRVISLPETARLALEALRLSRETGRLTRQRLISHIVQSYGLRKSFVKERLDFALSAEYLRESSGNVILLGDRTMKEIGYLKLLASGCKRARN